MFRSRRNPRIPLELPLPELHKFPQGDALLEMIHFDRMPDKVRILLNYTAGRHMAYEITEAMPIPGTIDEQRAIRLIMNTERHMTLVEGKQGGRESQSVRGTGNTHPELPIS